MVSIKQRYKRARARLNQIQKWATPAEAFVLSMFLAEKIIRRTLVQLVIRQGSGVDEAFETVAKLRGIRAVKKAWKKYDPHRRSLKVVIGSTNWDVLKEAAEHRNALVHGSEHQAQKVYKKQLRKLLRALDGTKQQFANEYRYSGWKRMKDADGNLI